MHCTRALVVFLVASSVRPTCVLKTIEFVALHLDWFARQFLNFHWFIIVTGYWPEEQHHRGRHVGPWMAARRGPEVVVA